MDERLFDPVTYALLKSQMKTDNIQNDSEYVTGEDLTEALNTLNSAINDNLKFPNKIKALTSNNNLNDLYNEADSGWYSLGANVQNAPESWCRMLVIGGGGCSQIIFTSTNIYTRMYTGSPLAWTAWRKFWNAENIVPKNITVSAHADTTWSNDAWFDAKCAAGGVVTICAGIVITSGGGSSGWKSVGVVQSGYRPSTAQFTFGFNFSGSGIGDTFVVRITEAGTIQIMALPNNTYCNFTTTYQV